MNKYLSLLRFSIRVFYKNKLHVALIITCLIISMSFSYVLLRKAFHDNQINKQYPDYKNTYRLVTYYKTHEIYQVNFNSEFLLKIKSEIPEINYGARLQLDYPNSISKLNQEEKICENFFLMDEDAFKIFNMKNLNGDKILPLKKGEILLSESKSAKLFNTSNAKGKTVSIKKSDNEYEFLVVGVFQNYPEQSTLTPDYIINFDSFYSTEQAVKVKSQLYISVETDDVKSTIAKINDLNPYPEDISFDLQPIDEIYFHSSHITGDFMNNKGNFLFHRLGISISIVLIFFGLINFISLSLSFYIHRIKEMYIRKVNGSKSKDFTILFFLELFLIFLVSTLSSYFLIYLVRSFFSITILTETFITLKQNVLLICVVLSVVFLFIFLSILVIRKGFLNKYIFGYWNYIKFKGNNRLNKVFNLFQLSIVILLVIFLTTISKQLSYSSSNVKGYKHSNLYKVNFPMYKGESKFQLLKQKLLQFPEINTVAGAQAAPMAHGCYYVNLTSKIDEKDVTCELLCVDKDYFEALQSNFINDFDLETLNSFTNSDIIINKTGAVALGIKNYSDELIDDYRIKAVVNDINYKTSTSKVSPRIYMISTRAISSVLVRSEMGNVKVLYDNILKQYKEVFPDFNPEIISYDDIIEKAYSEDIELKNILIIVFAVMFMLTVFGFFSIADYDFVKKVKGISVRRILGAKFVSLLVENIKKSLYIFLVSSFISGVLGFYLSKIWLANYYYRIDLNYSYFVGAIMIGFLIIILNILIFIIKMIKLDTCKVLKED